MNLGEQTSFNFEFSSTNENSELDFIVSSCNEIAFKYVTSWPNWHDKQVILSGPKYCGKSTLAKIWQQKSNAKSLNAKAIELDNIQDHKAYLMEGFENFSDDVMLFHLLNWMRENNKFIMLTTSINIDTFKDKVVKDLFSRLRAINCLEIGAPDQQLLQMIFVKHFSTRQLKVAPGVIDYLVARTERSYESIHKIVTQLDRESLKHKRNITIPFVREVMGDG